MFLCVRLVLFVVVLALAFVLDGRGRGKNEKLTNCPITPPSIAPKIFTSWCFCLTGKILCDRMQVVRYNFELIFCWLIGKTIIKQAGLV